MPQRLVTLTIPRVGTKDLIRQKGTLLRLRMRLGKKVSPRDWERIEGLLNFLDTCTDDIKEFACGEDGIGPEFWEPGA